MSNSLLNHTLPARRLNISVVNTLRAKELTAPQIAAQLNSEGYRKQNGRPLDAQTIYNCIAIQRRKISLGMKKARARKTSDFSTSSRRAKRTAPVTTTSTTTTTATHILAAARAILQTPQLTDYKKMEVLSALF
jgi:hypothetical protein